MSSKKRVESDLLGEVELDNSHLYGVQTARAIDNFKFSPFKINDYPHFVEGLALTKKGAAMAIISWAYSPISKPKLLSKPVTKSLLASITSTLW